MNATTKKTVVAKTIPKKIMGYLKFAHFIITHPETDILHTLFLDKSIEQIVTTVNDIVVNGDQDKIIIDLRKQFFLPEPKVKTKIKTKTNADLIVHDLVTLARTDTAPETIKAKKTRTKKHVDVAETVVVEEKPVIVAETVVAETVVVEEKPVIVAETVVVEEKPVIVKPKKQRAKKTDVDYSPECPSTAFLLTPLDESGEETVVAETVVVENTRSKKNRKNM
jgi:hypothetical protein